MTSKKLANLIPEFGGAYYEGGSFTVYLTDLGASGRAQQVILSNVADVQRGRPVRLIQGAYTYRELSAWAQCLLPHLAKDVASWGPWDRENRVRVEVVGDSALREIEAAISARKIPRNAFIFVTHPSEPRFVVDTGVIVVRSESASVIVAESVRAKIPFLIEVSTFAGGCTRQIARTDVSVLPAVAGETIVEVRPYDRRSTWPICTTERSLLKHRATVVVTTPGFAIIRVIGGLVGPPADSAGVANWRLMRIDRRIRVLPQK